MQNIAGCCQQIFDNKKFVDITQQSFASSPTFFQKFEVSLKVKVMELNPGDLLKSFLIYQKLHNPTDLLSVANNRRPQP